MVSWCEMGTTVDMHVHTIVGSMDSDISPKRLGEQAQAVGLTGIALTEHLHPWPADEVENFRREYGLFVFNAREWSTDMGHVTTFGLPREVRGIHLARDLRAACDDYGAYFVICHPFRYFPGDRKSTRLNSSHVAISYAVFCLKKKKKII